MSERGEPFSMFEPATGPSRWLIVGEAPGEEEDKAGRPFIGASGRLLNQLLIQSGFSLKLDDRGNRLESPFHITNVFTRRPPDNDLKKHWTLTKSELQKLGYSVTGRLPKLNKRFIHPEHEEEVARLHEEIRQLNPEFILMLGGTALWAITGESRITLNRGTLQPLHLTGSITCRDDTTSLLALDASPKVPLISTPSLLSGPAAIDSDRSCTPSSLSTVDSPAQDLSCLAPQSQLPEWAQQLSPLWSLPSFHPAMVLRQWDNRPLLWADLVKARRFLTRQLPPPLRRRLWVDPTLEEISEVYSRFLSRAPSPTDPLGVDIETDPRIGLMTTISFGFADEAICIPFYNKGALPTQCNYWATAREEAQAWRWVMRYAALPHPKVGQNFLYDHQYLLEDLDIRVRHIDDDTAILQHGLQPELPKALAVLASLYINEPAWKMMRESVKDENKADD